MVSLLKITAPTDLKTKHPLNITPPTDYNNLLGLARSSRSTPSPTDAGTSAPAASAKDDEDVRRSSGGSLIEAPPCLDTRTLSTENLMLHNASLSLQEEEEAASGDVMRPLLNLFANDELPDAACTDSIVRYRGRISTWANRPCCTPRGPNSCRSETAFSLCSESSWLDMQSDPLNHEDMQLPALDPLEDSETCTCTSCNTVPEITLGVFLEHLPKVEKELGGQDLAKTRRETYRQLLVRVEEETGERPARRRPRSTRAWRPSPIARRIGKSSYSSPGPGFLKSAAAGAEAHRLGQVSRHASNPTRPLATPVTPCPPILESPRTTKGEEVVVVTKVPECKTPSLCEMRWMSSGTQNIDCSAKDQGTSLARDKASLAAFLTQGKTWQDQYLADCKAQEDWSNANGIAEEAQNIQRNNNCGPLLETESERECVRLLNAGVVPDEELLRRVAADCYLRRCRSKSRKFFETINGDLLNFVWHAKNGETPSPELLQRVKNVLPHINTTDLDADFEPMKRFMGQACEANPKIPHPAVVLSGVDTRAKMPHLKKDPATRDQAEKEGVWAGRDGHTYLHLGLYDKNVDANLPEDKSDPKWQEHFDRQQKKTKLLAEKYLTTKRRKRMKTIARKERQLGRGNFIVPPEPRLTKKEEKEIRSTVSKFGVHRFKNRGICRVMFQKKGGDGPVLKAALAMLRALKTMNRLRALGISTVRWMSAADEEDFAK